MLRRFATSVLLAGGLTLATLGAPAAAAQDTPVAAAAATMSTKQIRNLTTQATVWALAPQFVYRFSRYNELINAPINELKYGQNAAAWNNSGSNAGDSSVMYLNGFIDFTQTDEMVLTVPPTTDTYYVANYLDSFINTIGSIGNRTTPSATATSYLLVSPSSPYASRQRVTIGGERFPVVASDTMLNWLVVRVRADALADASDPASTTSVYDNVVKQFYLNTLDEFQTNGNEPVAPASYVYTPTAEQIQQAEAYRNAPTQATEFFAQAGTSLQISPPPGRGVGLSGTPLRRLPAWIVPQYGAKKRFVAPSFDQRGELNRFAKIGLTANGFTMPSEWGAKQRRAFQKGFEKGMKRAVTASSGASPKPEQNYWSYDNTMIGTYANNRAGYLVRASVVLLGGSANIPADAVYPVINTADGSAQLDGDTTYSVTFTPPESTSSLPSVGTIPPMVTDEVGNTSGFWALSVYQPDSSQSSAPFLPQAAVVNRHYTRLDTEVLTVDADADTLTVQQPTWGLLAVSSPVVFGAGAEDIGLQADTVYYLAAAPVIDSVDGAATATFSLSGSWAQEISAQGVPIQNSGSAGAIVDLVDPGTDLSTSELAMGMVQPVSQLGSQQVASGDLQFSADGSLTIYIGPTLPDGAPASNWIPTPSTALYEQWYPGQELSTDIRVMLRMYYPTPGSTPPSILPDSSGETTYVPPALVAIPTA